MISPSMKDGEKSSIPHCPVAVTLLCAHQNQDTDMQMLLGKVTCYRV